MLRSVMGGRLPNSALLKSDDQNLCKIIHKDSPRRNKTTGAKLSLALPNCLYILRGFVSVYSDLLVNLLKFLNQL
jgi:hypothetical protein